MRVCRISLIVLAISILAIQARAEENYWQIVKRYLEEDNANPSAEGSSGTKEFLASLSADELIIAARQCSAEMEQKVPPEEWDMAGMTLGFFYEYYPFKSNNLEDISPLLSDLKDKSQSSFWRHSIMQLLGTEWHRQLRDKPQSRLKAAYVMNDILLDTSEPTLLRVKAAIDSSYFLTNAHTWNLGQDIEIDWLVKKGAKLGDVIKDVKKGKVTPTNETIERNKKIETTIAKSIQAQIDILAEPNLPAYLGVNLLGSLTRLVGFDETGQIKQAMNNALHNYKNYDEYLWRYLIRANIIYFGNEEAKSILQQMINDAKNKHEKEYTLPELKRDLDKGKIERKPYVPGSSLVKLP